MKQLFLLPPFAFIATLIFAWLLARLLSGLSFKPRKKQAEATSEPYACGEDTYNHSAQPDYSVFFSFAFFFTLAHVATLVVASAPRESLSSLVMAIVYILGAVLGLSILLRK